ncbi:MULTISPECIES: hypothetical protein [unclassified Streptomyces]|nr:MULTISPECIES: hypothetical protein [unclassified Streptomyces]MYT28482.1 hypothetical protein [Streptomyces sp. SID8354]
MTTGGAWLDGLTEEELAELLCGLAECLDAMWAAGGDAVDGPEGTELP